MGGMPGALAIAGGSHAAGCHCPVWRTWAGEILPLPLGPFHSLDWSYLLEMSHLSCYFGTHGREGGAPLVSLKPGPGEGVKILTTTCSSVRNVLFALEQDMPSDGPEAFFIAR